MVPAGKWGTKSPQPRNRKAFDGPRPGGRPLTTTGLTLDLLRRSGYTAAVVESWIPRIERRRDLFGFADVLGVHPHRRPGMLLVQCTSIGHVGDRLKKARGKPALRVWLAAGGAFEVHGWVRRATGWAVKRIAVTGDDLAEVLIEQPRRRRPQPNQAELFS